MKYRYKILLFCLSCFLFLSCDRATKSLAKDRLMNQPPSFFLNDFFILHYTENTGAAMSLGADLPQPYNFILLSALPLLFIILLFVYSVRRINEFNSLKAFSFSLLIAGGLGNIIDRIFFDRHVADFMILQIGKYHTGIFNVADVCVTSGVIGLLLFFNNKKKVVEVYENEVVED